MFASPNRHRTGFPLADEIKDVWLEDYRQKNTTT